VVEDNALASDEELLTRFLDEGVGEEPAVFDALVRAWMRHFELPPSMAGTAVVEISVVGAASYHEVLLEVAADGSWCRSPGATDDVRRVTSRWQRLEHWAEVELGRMHLATALSAKRVITGGDELVGAELLRTMTVAPGIEGRSFLQVFASVWMGEVSWASAAAGDTAVGMFEEIMGYQAELVGLRQLSDFAGTRLSTVVPMPKGLGPGKLVGHIAVEKGTATCQRNVRDPLRNLGPGEVVFEVESLEWYLSSLATVPMGPGERPDPVEALLNGQVRVYGAIDLLPVLFAALELM
jgi:hypothetical protein